MNDSSLHKYHAEAINLLSQIIATPSLSREEGAAADLMKNFLSGKGVEVKRNGNNVWCINKYFDRQKPTILLNSHLDTVPASAAYTQDPHKAITVAGNLYGLGSTDAGG
ncbi:MAG: acetylornithine deacetylase, partial [Ferruginibacter sp.]